MQIEEHLGDYFLLQRLAMGGQSEVYLALRRGTHGFHRSVVLKVLPEKAAADEQLVALFYQEAFISARLSHPHLISIHDARMIEGEHVMTMDFVAGQTVADIAQRAFQQGQPLSLLQTVQIIADACDGLHYVHIFRDVDDQEYQVTHCDVSPQNLMVTYEGITKVFDFGISKIQGRGDVPEVAAGGKYSYMSPEQCQGGNVDPRSDIFSLGIILYELATGFRLFRRDSTPEVIRALMEEPIEAPSKLNEEVPIFLERCIMKALERDPNLRYQSAAEFRGDLLDFLAIHRSTRVRVELGEAVGRLFDEERQEMVQLLRRSALLAEAPERHEEREALEEDPAPEASEVPEVVEKPGSALEDREVIKERKLEAERGRRRAKLMNKRIKGLQRRQSFLVAALLLVSLLALAMGIYHFQAASARAEAASPAQFTGAP